MINPLEELAAIKKLEQQNLEATRWFTEIVIFLLIISFVFILTACDNIQPRCLLADTNNECDLLPQLV